MARSLIVPEAGQPLVRVANFSDKVLTLRSPLPVAKYHTVSGVSGSATPTEIGPYVTEKKARALLTDLCCPKEKAKPSAIRREQNS